MSRILNWIREQASYWLPSRASVAERVGLYSTYSEVHATVLGIGRGFRHGCTSKIVFPEKHDENPRGARIDDDMSDEAIEDVKTNPWYWEFGYILGDVLQIAVILVALYLASLVA
jgi:hypothetical protein